MASMKKLSSEQCQVIDVLANRTPLTRGQLAAMTGWSRNTAASRLEELRLEEWVTVSEEVSSGGRPATVYSLNANKALLFIAIFGYSHVTWGVLDLLGTVLASEVEPFSLHRGPREAIETAQGAATRLLTSAGRPPTSLGAVVLGVPSPIDTSTRRSINPSAMPGWVGFDIVGAFGQAFGLPVSVENDAKLMAVGSKLSYFPDAQNLVFIKVGTGIGAGIISGGVLQQGMLGMAGEIGHLAVSSSNRQCDCGKTGCIVRYVSIGAVLKDLQDSGTDVADLDELLALAMSGNPECSRVLRQAGRRLGEIVAVLLAIVNPELVILGGRITSLGNDLVAGMRETLYASAHPMLTSNLRTLVIKEHDQAALRGAAAVGFADFVRGSSRNAAPLELTKAATGLVA